jgi:hypothetical protein
MSPPESQLDVVLRHGAHRQQRPVKTSMRLCKQTDSNTACRTGTAGADTQTQTPADVMGPHPEQPPVMQLVKNFPLSYAALWFINVTMRALY